jgi:hypothetical protein
MRKIFALFNDLAQKARTRFRKKERKTTASLSSWIIRSARSQGMDMENHLISSSPGSSAGIKTIMQKGSTGF